MRVGYIILYYSIMFEFIYVLMDMCIFIYFDEFVKWFLIIKFWSIVSVNLLSFLCFNWAMFFFIMLIVVIVWCFGY